MSRTRISFPSLAHHLFQAKFALDFSTNFTAKLCVALLFSKKKETRSSWKRRNLAEQRRVLVWLVWPTQGFAKVPCQPGSLPHSEGSSLFFFFFFSSCELQSQLRLLRHCDGFRLYSWLPPLYATSGGGGGGGKLRHVATAASLAAAAAAVAEAEAEICVSEFVFPIVQQRNNKHGN